MVTGYDLATSSTTRSSSAGYIPPSPGHHPRSPVPPRQPSIPPYHHHPPHQTPVISPPQYSPQHSPQLLPVPLRAAPHDHRFSSRSSNDDDNESLLSSCSGGGGGGGGFVRSGSYASFGSNSGGGGGGSGSIEKKQQSGPRSGNSTPSISQAGAIPQFKARDPCGTSHDIPYQSHDIEATPPTYSGEEGDGDDYTSRIQYPNHSKIIVLPLLDEDKLVKKENPEELESKLQELVRFQDSKIGRGTESGRKSPVYSDHSRFDPYRNTRQPGNQGIHGSLTINNCSIWELYWCGHMRYHSW